MYESNGIGKEYNSYSDKLIYEGEYLNGKRNGKGKEYDNCFGTIYEGEYLNGKRNGKGKEYHRTGEIIFEGEYFDNKRWIGTGYVEGKKIYTLSNDTNGKGQEFNNSGTLIFEGEYLEGKRNGKGKEYDFNGKLLFEGEYKNDLKWNGIGYDSLNNILYELKDGKGLVKEYDDYNDKLEFEGEYLNGKRNGKGKEYNGYDGHLMF